MRTDIFYWKCDSPMSAEAKKAVFFKDKYAGATREKVSEAVSLWLGHAPSSLEIPPSFGNHLVAFFSDSGRRFFFRADEGKASPDDYMLAESTVMNLLHKQGLPVPPVYYTDISLEKFPFRFQIMDFCDTPCLNQFAKDGTLDEQAVARQSGKILAAVHGLQFPGYGFFNTELLAEKHELRGLDDSAAAYFDKCLDSHLGYLREHGLLAKEMEERLCGCFGKARPLLQNIPGSLLHRDYAYWNILGDPGHIRWVIDWDDCVSGDPADDFGIVNCFLRPELLEIMLESYAEERSLDESFRVRIHLHTVRNMLWKAMIRHYMGYFEKGKDFFLSPSGGASLREVTFRKISSELQLLEESL